MDEEGGPTKPPTLPPHQDGSMAPPTIAPHLEGPTEPLTPPFHQSGRGRRHHRHRYHRLDVPITYEPRTMRMEPSYQTFHPYRGPSPYQTQGPTLPSPYNATGFSSPGFRAQPPSLPRGDGHWGQQHGNTHRGGRGGGRGGRSSQD